MNPYASANRADIPQETFSDLTDREREILVLIGQGKTNEAIDVDIVPGILI